MTDMLNFDENKFRPQEVEMKRAREQRVDEVSVQKSRENHETVQKLASQLQQMQEQMGSMNDSGDFQDVESNYSGRLSHVSSQPAMIPSSRALLSRDKRLPLDTWNRDHLLTHTRSELVKQEHKVGSLNTCTCELQQQTYAQRLELEDAQSRICRISKRASPTARRISHERKSFFEELKFQAFMRWEK